MSVLPHPPCVLPYYLLHRAVPLLVSLCCYCCCLSCQHSGPTCFGHTVVCVRSVPSGVSPSGPLLGCTASAMFACVSTQHEAHLSCVYSTVCVLPAFRWRWVSPPVPSGTLMLATYVISVTQACMFQRSARGTLVVCIQHCLCAASISLEVGFTTSAFGHPHAGHLCLSSYMHSFVCGVCHLSLSVA